jgi:transcription-repair coupling factor (superfamily II helicase)
MTALTRVLKSDKDFSELLSRLEYGGCPVVYSGLGGIHKAHAAASVRALASRPLAVVCPDELEAERMRADLAVLTGESVLGLTAREFVFFNADSVSRSYEHERISALYQMARGTAGIIVATPDALMQRTLPLTRLLSSSLEIKLGEELSPSALAEALLLAGYRRSDEVEGAGQFAVRGGIVDFFSPAYDQPVRVDFYGDEIDAMGLFDISTQRRTENIDTVTVLPTAECLPCLADGGGSGFAQRLADFVKRLEKRKNPPRTLIDGIMAALEKISAFLAFSAYDKYFELIYSDFATAADYLPSDAAVFICEPSRCGERGKNYAWQLNQDCEALIESHSIEGSLANFHKSWEEICGKLADRPVVMTDSFRSGSYPLAPRALLNMTAKQLPSYGGSFSTAAGDIIHYLRDGYRTVVLCSDRRKAELMNEYLSKNGIAPSLDYALSELPKPSCCAVSVGALSAGFEYPGLKLAVITEGQLTAPAAKISAKKKGLGNRRKLQSYTDLSKGDFVVHENHGIGRFVGIFRLSVDGVESRITSR